MPKCDTDILLKFYTFWVWEYVKRRHLSGHVKMHGPYKGQNQGWYKINNFILMESEKECLMSTDSDGLIFRIASNTFQCKYPRKWNVHSAVRYLNPHDYRITELKYDHDLHEVYEKDITKQCFDGKYVVEIDRSADVNVAIAELKYIHTGVSTDMDELLIRNNSKLSRFPREGRDIVRAVGLWLWDFMRNNSISIHNKSKAIAAFHKKYHTPDNGEIYIDKYHSDSQLAEKLEITTRCIEIMDVLPMS